MVDKNKLKKYTYKSHDGKIDGYYIGYCSIYSDKVSATESEAIKNALKNIGGMDYIYELRFHLNSKAINKKSAFYEKAIGTIDNYRRERPVYESILAGRVHKRYLLSKDGRKIKVIQ